MGTRDPASRTGDAAYAPVPFPGDADHVLTARGHVGSGDVRLGLPALDRAAADAALRDPEGRTGAVVTFTGVARSDVPAGAAPGEQVVRLEFECYLEMAEAELARLRIEAIDRFGLNGLVIQHRLGDVPVGEEIVLVSAGAAHRAAAFAAAAWTMDEIKRRVPIWKREVASDGTVRWGAARMRGRGPTGGADGRHSDRR